MARYLHLRVGGILRFPGVARISTLLLRRDSVKNANKVAIVIVIVAVSAMLFSGFAFSQTVLSVFKVPGVSPNSLIAINNGWRLVVNTGTAGSYQVSTWN